MEQIAGDQSFLVYINRTYSYKLSSELHTGSKIDADQLIASQWGSRSVTKNKKILIFDDPTVEPLNSIYDLYNSEKDSSFPDNFEVPFGFEPELNYFLEEKLNFSN